MSFCSGDLETLNIQLDCEGLEGNFLEDLGEDSENSRKEPVSVSQSLVLDSEKGELVKAAGRAGKRKGASGGKSLAALKSHSEAERRRRERINAHLGTLRGLVPSSEKMDKAALLAEVISQVKQLKEAAAQVSEGLPIPMDSDEVRVEQIPHDAGDGAIFFRASLCCDYSPELFSYLKQTLNALHLNLVKSEISTLGNRVKNVLVFTSSREGNQGPKTRELLVSSVHQALTAVLDKISASSEYSPEAIFSNKRRRTSYFDSSSSSS